MQEYLVFQLYGPLASWGDQAVGSIRPSTPHPGRSALLGLLAAALGIKREEEERQQRLNQLCCFGIKQLSPGLLLRDYHTTQVPPGKHTHLYTRKDELSMTKLETILSAREYRQDSAALVAIWLSEETEELSLSRMKEVLLKPMFQLYLGRKSCPLALPLNPVLYPVETMKEAIDRYQPDNTLDFFQKQDTSYYWEETPHAGLLADFHIRRYDQSLSRTRWQFGSRREYVHLERED